MIVGGLIGVALWILMAVFNGRGASWARIVATVLGGISVLSAVSLFVQTVPAFTLVVGILQVVLAIVTGLVATGLLHHFTPSLSSNFGLYTAPATTANAPLVS